MCLLTLEWSEAIVSCNGTVNYNLTITPDVVNATAMNIYSGSENRYTYTVDGEDGLQYNFRLTTEICGDQNFTMYRPVDLSGINSVIQ